MFGLSSATDRARLSAIDMISTKIMIADKELNITYMNPATRELLKEAESDLKKELPRFNVSTLIGSNIDIFHKNPSHQRNMLAALKTQHKATISVGQRAFDLIVTPLCEGHKISGFVVEWADANVRLMNFDYQGQMEALGRVQAVIEFTLTGEIVSANQNFCDVLGYRLDEIVGRHHSIFVDRAYASSPDYHQFWEQLRSGKFQAAEFVRHGKSGKRVVINASYNPIFDEKGRVAKVVKFATDVTARVENVDQLAGALKALSEGDLTSTLGTPFLPSLETLRVDFNEASSMLRGALQQISQNAGAIAAASQEIQSA
nr:PAS domain-containing protein [uncultured Dongia sp.]